MNPEEIQYSCLEPRGNFCDLELFPLSKRIDELDKKTVFFVDTGKEGAEFLLRTAMEFMQKRYPQANLVYYPKTTSYRHQESEEWWKELESNADAAVVAVGD